MEKGWFFQQVALEQLDIHMEKRNLDLYFNSYAKHYLEINHSKSWNYKLLEEIIGENIDNL